MLTTEQQAVQKLVRQATEKGVRTVCIPGAPGTGRFTLLRELLAEEEAQGKSCLFVSPTGRGAALLRSRGRCTAKPIHAFLTEVAKGEMPVQDVVVVSHAEMLDAIISGPTPDEIYAGLLKACKTLIICVESSGLYSVVSNPVFEQDGMCITRNMQQVMRQRMQ